MSAVPSGSPPPAPAAHAPQVEASFQAGIAKLMTSFPKLLGTGTEDVLLWLKQFEVAATSLNIARSGWKTAVQNVVAPDVYAALSAFGSFARSKEWDSVKEDIIAIFSPRSSQSAVDAELRNCLQNSDSVAVFLKRFLSVMYKMSPVPPLDSVRNLFVSNLRPEIQESMKYQSCDSFADVLKWAKIAEPAIVVSAVSSSSAASHPAPAPFSAPVLAAASAPTSFKPHQGKFFRSSGIKRSAGKPSSFKAGNAEFFDGNCLWCLNYGHKEASCRYKAAGKPKRTPSNVLFVAADEDSSYNQLILATPALNRTVGARRIPIIAGIAGGLPISVGLDTCAANSVMSLACVERLGLKVRDCPLSLRHGGDQTMKLVGAVVLAVSLGGKSFTIPFAVTARFPLDCVVGWDFFRRENGMVDAASMTCRIGTLTIPIPDTGPPASVTGDPFLAVMRDCSHIDAISIGKDLPPAVQARARRLLEDFADCFARDEDQFGTAAVSPADIIFADGPPLRSRPIRHSRPDAMIIENTVQLWLRQGRIRPSTSPHAAPVFLVPKFKDGVKVGHRLVVNLSRMNERITPDNMPAADARNIFDSLAGKSLFSTLDFQWAYLQIPVAESSRQILSFVTESGQYEFCFLPFGLNVAGAKLQRELNMVFQGILELHGYADDWSLATPADFDHHLALLRTCLERVRQSGFLLKPSKCKVMAREIRLLGRIVSAQGHRADPLDVHDLLAVPAPVSPREVLSFLGSAQWLAPYVKDFQLLTGPLRTLTRKEATWHWGLEQQKAFDEIKALMTSPELMAFPDFSQRFTLEVDASERGYGAVLLQKGRPVAYASRATTPAERGGVHATVLELSAIRWALERFHVYLGAEFDLVTDHRALSYLKSAHRPSGKFARWAAELNEYRFVVRHRPGKLHHSPDMLSRLFPVTVFLALFPQPVAPDTPAPRDPDSPSPPTPKTSSPPLANFVPSIAAIRAAQAADEFCSSKIAGLSSTPGPFCLSPDDLLASVFYRHGAPHFRVVLPRSLLEQAVRAVHVQAGHQALRETLRRFAAAFWSPAPEKDIRAIVDACPECLRRKGPAANRSVPVGSLTALRPGEVVAVDIVSLSPTPSGLVYALSCIDHFSKYAVVIPLKSKTSVEAAEAFTAGWLRPFGPPERVHSDQGGEFAGAAFEALLRASRIKHSYTTAYHPQGDGVVERFNRTIVDILSTLCGPTKSCWPDFVAGACVAYNASTHSATGHTPFLLWFGRSPPTILSSSMVPAASPAEIIAADKADAAEARAYVADVSVKKRQLLAKVNSSASVTSFSVGNLVMVRNPAIRQAPFSKLQDSWEGPFRVIALGKSPATYMVTQLPSGRSGSTHVCHMKPFHGAWPASPRRLATSVLSRIPVRAACAGAPSAAAPSAASSGSSTASTSSSASSSLPSSSLSSSDSAPGSVQVPLPPRAGDSSIPAAGVMQAEPTRSSRGSVPPPSPSTAFSEPPAHPPLVAQVTSPSSRPVSAHVPTVPIPLARSRPLSGRTVKGPLRYGF